MHSLAILLLSCTQAPADYRPVCSQPQPNIAVPGQYLQRKRYWTPIRDVLFGRYRRTSQPPVIYTIPLELQKREIWEWRVPQPPSDSAVMRPAVWRGR